MIRHSLKLIWNQKRKNGYLILELFLLFMVLFLSSIYLIEKTEMYLEGTGADVNNTFFMWLVKKDYQEGQYKKEFLELKRQLNELSEVENVSYNRDAIPYTWNMSAGGIKHDSTYANVVFRYADENFGDVLRLDMLAGEWFKDDYQGINTPAVIDKKTSLELFGSVENALNKVVQSGGKEFKVEGVIDLLKRNDYEGDRGTIIMPCPMDSVSLIQILVRYHDGCIPNPAELTKIVYSLFDKNEFAIRYASTMEAKKAQVSAEINSEVKLIILVATFLIINLILGLIGILGYKAKRRNSELGIRRAMGSTATQLHKLLLFESWSLTIMALIPALIIVIQIPMLDLLPVSTALFLKSIVTSVALIFLFVTLSVYYPGRLAAKVQPAEALQEE